MNEWCVREDTFFIGFRGIEFLLTHNFCDFGITNKMIPTQIYAMQSHSKYGIKTDFIRLSMRFPILKAGWSYFLCIKNKNPDIIKNIGTAKRNAPPTRKYWNAITPFFGLYVDVGCIILGYPLYEWVYTTAMIDQNCNNVIFVETYFDIFVAGFTPKYVIVLLLAIFPLFL